MLLKNFRLPGCNFSKSTQLLIQGEKITGFVNDDVGSEVIDCRDRYLIPGLFDLQLYGAGGCLFEEDLTEASIYKIHQHHLKYGTTGFLITLPSTSFDKIKKAIAVVAACLKKGNTGLFGLHLEGPFINVQKGGAHNPEYIKVPDAASIDEIIRAGKGIVKMMTIAPELFSDALLEKFAGSGIVLSAGHSNATYDQAQHAFSKGISCSTHLYNAMSPLESRTPGLTGATLLNDHVWSTIVADGVHVCFETMALTFKLKSEKLILISDATFLDVETDKLRIAGVRVVKRNGAFYTIDGRLAGSAISLFEAVRNCITKLQVPAAIAFDMATTRAAALIGNRFSGSIETGKEASLLLVNDHWDIEGILFKGTWIKKLV